MNVVEIVDDQNYYVNVVGNPYDREYYVNSVVEMFVFVNLLQYLEIYFVERLLRCFVIFVRSCLTPFSCKELKMTFFPRVLSFFPIFCFLSLSRTNICENKRLREGRRERGWKDDWGIELSRRNETFQQEKNSKEEEEFKRFQ